MTNQNNAAQAALTPERILAISNASVRRDGSFDSDSFAREIELELSKLRAPVADERALIEKLEAWQAVCDRIVDQYGGVVAGVDFAALGRANRAALASAPVAGEAVAWEIPNPHLGSELTSHKARADEARRLGLTVHELFRHAAPQASAMPVLNDAMRAVINNERDVYETPDALYAALCDAAGAPSSSPRRRRSRDMADLQQLAFDLSERDWTWWDSCSFRRLTFDDGPDTADGSALYGTVHSSDGHPDVQMAPGVREFIEAASPKNVAHIFRELEAEKRKVAVLRHAILKHLNDTDKKEK